MGARRAGVVSCWCWLVFTSERVRLSDEDEDKDENENENGGGRGGCSPSPLSKQHQPTHQHKPARALWPPERLPDQAHDQVVRHQGAALHRRLGLEAQLRLCGDGGAQQVARGEVAQAVLGLDGGGLGALAGARGALLSSMCCCCFKERGREIEPCGRGRAGSIVGGGDAVSPIGGDGERATAMARRLLSPSCILTSMMMCLSGFCAQSMRRFSSPIRASVERSVSADAIVAFLLVEFFLKTLLDPGTYCRAPRKAVSVVCL